MKDEEEEDIVPNLSPEEADARAAALFGEGELKKLASSAWKERLEGVQNIKQAIHRT